MFKEMRRIDRQADPATIERILTNGEYGILSTTGNNGYSYGVPLNYVYTDNNIYFHCAREGLKLDNIEYNNCVCFTIVGDTKVLPQSFSTSFESVVIFGKAVIVVDENEKNNALKAIIKKFSPDYIEAGNIYISKSGNHTLIVRIDIEKITGKQRQE